MWATAKQYAIGLVVGAIIPAALAGGYWWIHRPTPSPTPILTLPNEIAAKVGRLCRIQPQTKYPLTWIVIAAPAGVTKEDYDFDGEADEADLVSPIAGQYRIEALAVYKGTVVRAETTVMVGGTPPTPPVPPPPTPPQPPAPIPADGLRVLVVYDVNALGKMAPNQRAILYSEPLRDLLTQKCVKGPDGKTAEWRFYSQNEDTTNESAIWQGAMKRERKSLPWLIISNGKTGFEGPLPTSVDEMTALVNKLSQSM